MNQPQQPVGAAVARRDASFLDTLKAVAWSFVGLRKRADLERDGTRLNPVHVIVVGLAAVLVFVFALIGVVNWVVAK